MKYEKLIQYRDLLQAIKYIKEAEERDLSANQEHDVDKPLVLALVRKY